MERILMNDLKSWKKSVNRKPLIIRGARQVGKTWLMKEFSRNNYEKTAYINFENNIRMQNLFKDDFDLKRIMTAMQIETGISIKPENTLIIFDEIQEVPNALRSLKYFYENASEYHIITAGSLPGIAHHKGESFPVGKVDFLSLYPLNFAEFLFATGNRELYNLLESLDFKLIKSYKNKFIDLLKMYYFTGGMPEAVSAFIESNNLNTVREIQNRILTGYELDLSKHVPKEIVPRIRMLWDSIPSQLAKENRKFIYGLIKKGARAREYELALNWLYDSGLVYKISRIKKPAVPLKAYTDTGAFKLFFIDVGLLGALSGLEAKAILESKTVFEEFKGALTEQYILQELIVSGCTTPFYWSSERGTSEIDFVFQIDDKIIPIEVKASENLQAKSLKIYCQKYNPEYAVRTSLSDYRKESWLINVPLYAADVLYKICQRQD